MSVWGNIGQFVLLVSVLVALLSALFWARSLDQKVTDAHRKLGILRDVIERQASELAAVRANLGQWQQYTGGEFRRMADAVTVIEEALGLPTGRDDDGRENGHA